jgi:hypothetical protein
MPVCKLPYLNAYGNIKKALDKIKQAETQIVSSETFWNRPLA